LSDYLPDRQSGKWCSEKIEVECTQADDVEQVMKKFGSDLQKIKNISMDMSPTYALVFNDLVPRAVQVIDKFYVMKYVYEAVGDVRERIVKERTEYVKQVLGKHKDLKNAYQISQDFNTKML
jgi:transposase